MNAINPATGAEMPHFPVEIKGPASNNPQQLFRPSKELQRPGLLFLNGVVYAAFGSHCDLPALCRVHSRRVDQRSADDDVDRRRVREAGAAAESGRAVVGLCPTARIRSCSRPATAKPTTPHHPNGVDPRALTACEPGRFRRPARRATRRFVEGDRLLLDAQRRQPSTDMTGTSPAHRSALPSEFSTPKYPHLLVATGKEGIVYLLEPRQPRRPQRGPGGRDVVVGEYGPNGQAISTAGVWPGDGGYVYVATTRERERRAGEVDVYKFTTTSEGVPGLQPGRLPARSRAVFGVSGPLVTSDGTTSGSAVVWVIDGACLQAYDPVPVQPES